MASLRGSVELFPASSAEMSLVPLDSSLGEDFISVSADFCRNYPLLRLKRNEYRPGVILRNKNEHH